MPFSIADYKSRTVCNSPDLIYGDSERTAAEVDQECYDSVVNHILDKITKECRVYVTYRANDKNSVLSVAVVFVVRVQKQQKQQTPKSSIV